MKNWKYLYASVQGKGHIEEGVRCQDNCNVFENGRYTICVVSDGAGSCENSDIGAEHVIKFANIHFSKLIEKRNWHKGKRQISPKEWRNDSRKVLKAIRNDLEKVSIQGYGLKSLSCTIIVVININSKLLVTHIGDGRAGYCNHKDEWYSMLVPYKGTYNNETVFITSDFWEDKDSFEKYIESVIIEDKVKAFCLLSDGCENASFECYHFDEKLQVSVDINRPFKDFFSENVNVHIPNLIKEGKTQMELNKIWESFLKNGNKVLQNEMDDKTMILAVKIPHKKNK